MSVLLLGLTVLSCSPYALSGIRRNPSSGITGIFDIPHMSDSQRQAAELELHISAADEYDANTPLAIQVEVRTRNAAGGWRVATFAPGTLHIDYVMRSGVPVVPWEDVADVY